MFKSRAVLCCQGRWPSCDPRRLMISERNVLFGHVCLRSASFLRIPVTLSTYSVFPLHLDNYQVSVSMATYCIFFYS